ncbi:MAG: ShlB/FhaC/HecB family hemolysin secretion/activation protein [Nitrospinae bacterium]|nr:ShlB/FhaC/HecB family hemolysin secretion/activation protein [Nitrospinota bacterium]
MRRYKKFLSCFIIIGTLVFVTSTRVVYAQNVNDSSLSEKALRQSQTPEIIPNKKTSPDIFIQDSRKLVDPGAGPSFFVKKIILEGNTIFNNDTLLPIVEVGDGLNLTLGILALMAQEVSAYYASEGYFLARAYIPQQEVKDGVVKIKIVEGKIGKINITGNKKVKTTDIQKHLGELRQKSVVKEQALESVLDDLNSLMGMNVRTILRPGELPGTSDLILDVTETPPYFFSLDTDNFGSKYLGKNRLGMTLIRGNIFTLGDQFTIRGVTSDLKQDSVSLSYLYPLFIPNLNVGTSYSYSEQEIGANLKNLQSGGLSESANVNLSYTLYRTKNSQLRLKGGFEFKRSQNYLFNMTSSDEHFNNFYINLSGNFTDRFQGMNFFSTTVTKGIAENKRNRALNSRTEALGNVTSVWFSVNRYQRLPFFDSYVLMKGTAQAVSARTLSSNLFVIGGMGSVRGFPLSEYSGDNGYIASLEYVLPVPLKINSGIADLPLNKILSINGFIDHGESFMLRKQIGDSNASISGVGGGAQLNIPQGKDWMPAITVATSYAVPVRGPRPSDMSYGKFYFNVMASYTF